MTLTSTTAPGKVFSSRSELAEHYKSDWHRYNLKRKESNLPILTEAEFQVRLAAALALKKEKDETTKHLGTSHLKHKPVKSQAKCEEKLKLQDGSFSETPVTGKQQQQQQQQQQNLEEEVTVGSDEIHNKEMRVDVKKVKDNDLEQTPVIDPLQCLFSNQQFESLQLNLEHMRCKYGFFIPEMEHLVDRRGLVGYCHEKVKLGHCCLYCQKIFPTWRGTQQHMIDARHCKLRYEEGIDLDEYEPFYDFDAANKEFLEHFNGPSSKPYTNDNDNHHDQINEVEINDDNDDEWEDFDDNDDDDDVSMENYYQEHVLKRGFDVTILGELIFPDGRVIGHRGLARFYKQRYSTSHTDSSAVSAYRRSLGISPGQHLRGHGILVPQPKYSSSAGLNGALLSTETGLSNYSTLSVYRYKAVIKKQRQQDSTGYRQYQKYFNRHNRFDKKGNRIMNGVSVAHAKR